MTVKKSDLLTPKNMVETKGGYAELQPIASGPSSALERDQPPVDPAADHDSIRPAAPTRLLEKTAPGANAVRRKRRKDK